MKKALIILLSVLALGFVVQNGLKLAVRDVYYVHACRPGEPILDCRTYKADIVLEPMDGVYLKEMYTTDFPDPITFEPISNDSSYDKGCWLGHKRGRNELEYNVCQSSFGEWIILQGYKNAELRQ